MFHNAISIPFNIGLLFVLGSISFFCLRWMVRAGTPRFETWPRLFFSMNTLRGFRSIIMESLLHRKIFRVNPLLGYMHMSLAFGWFLLIVFGHLQASFYAPGSIHPPHYSIFFRYFEPDATGYPHHQIFDHLMDFLLLLILSGVGLAFYKRFRSARLGMKKTTKPGRIDKAALLALWLIFPLRLLAESATSGISGIGGFLSLSLGNLLSEFFPLQNIEFSLWMAYSLSLGSFFLVLPFSRYMHIPMEPFLIMFRHWGLEKGRHADIVREAELLSCSSCGICIDPCQMSADAGISGTQSVYLMKAARTGQISESLASSCMVCGRCSEFCPVGIDLATQRLSARKRHYGNLPLEFRPERDRKPEAAELAYFSGCMSRLTPGITHSFREILRIAGVSFVQIDREEGVCCGRPMKLAGKDEASQTLREANTRAIMHSGARMLVSNCPICVKSFREEYLLPGVKILHHSEYLYSLWKEGKLKLAKQMTRLVYHDPCELGRGLGIYSEPRELLVRTGILKRSPLERSESLCCAGSVSALNLGDEQRQKMGAATIRNLLTHKPDIIATACPLCKTSLKHAGGSNVSDLAEIVLANLKLRKDSRLLQQETELHNWLKV